MKKYFLIFYFNDGSKFGSVNFRFVEFKSVVALGKFVDTCLYNDKTLLKIEVFSWSSDHFQLPDSVREILNHKKS